MATNVSIDIEHDELEIVDNAPRGPEEKKWRLSHLRSQFQSLQLDNLYKPYTDKINHGYFSLFLILQFCLSVTHFVVIFISNYTTDENVSIILPDLILYTIVAILSLIGIFTIDFFMNKYKSLTCLVCSAFVLIFFMNFFVPIYHELSNNGHFRPTYTTHLLLYCYIFLNLPSNLLAIGFGIIITVCHLLCLYFINYQNTDHSILWRRMSSDTLYLICINVLGMNFQYLNEIIKRRSFLDRRDCIVSKYQIGHEQKQEEQLLLSIIPRSIIAKVKEHYLSNIDIIKNEKYVTDNPFDDSLLEEHTNVTILFADIVNYTEMTTKLNIIELLDTLNELFGSFDDASEVLKVTRIKFLGDCYYCVSGLPPNPAPNHGEACVDLGLQMISLIAEVRNRRNLNINMRIGIHTGKIISGIIGKVKYQFDIWSKDVDIANRMETEGVAGKVHITEETRRLLKKDYDIVATNKGETVPLFAQNGINTYLITPKKCEQLDYVVKPLKQDTNSEIHYENAPRPSKFKKRTSNKPNNSINSSLSGTTYLSQLRKSGELDGIVANEASTQYENQLKNSLQKKRNSTMLTNSLKRDTRILEEKRLREEVKRRTAFMNTNIKRHNEMSEDVNAEMTETILNLSFSKYRQFFTFHEVNNLLCFRKCVQEIGYIKQSDPLFKFYLLSNLFVLICTYVIQNLTLAEWNWTSWQFYTTLGVIVSLLPFTWTYFIWSRYVYTWMKDELPKKSILRFFYKSSTFISDSFSARLLIYTIVMVLFSVCILSEVIECEIFISNNGTFARKHNFLSLLLRQTSELNNQECAIPWHMTETCSLAIIMAFLFIRTVIWVKFVYALSITLIYAYCVTLFGNKFYTFDETFNYRLKPQYAHILTVAFLTFTLHLIDRQTDYMNRLDYLTAEKLKESQSRANDLHMINKILLNNILPQHVALKYLDLDRDLEEVYHEYHSNVAVMFASIIISEEDKNLLSEKRMLMEINNYIVDFDKILRREEFNGKIEKIKMSKWTYMAVCGLNPDKRAEIERHSSQSPIIILLDFASKIMQQTQKLSNNESFGRDIKLRIGIAHGNIVAGVVGSKKPLYDVWGDAVNMASRMDTTGMIDRIQIIGSTAEIVENIGYDLEYRGEIHVKGRQNLVPTYFVKLDKNYNLIRKEI